MKELSIEEKAKRYDEAKLRMSAAYNSNRCTIGFMNEIFPELAESKDERIRQATINVFATHKDYEIFFGASVEDILAWLEKQGEQKPAYKVEPKFHEGEWVVFNNKHESVYQVERIDNYRYYLRHYLGGTLSVHFDNELIRPWTIQDAREGDVISDGNNPFIFKKTKYNSNHCYAFCGIGQDGNFMVNPYNWYGKESSSGVWTWGRNLKPATKEQRDLLFQKMKEAGYEWDAEKKELKKIEQKSAESDDLIEESYQQQADDLIDMVTEKSAWSEEDEEILDGIIVDVEVLKGQDRTKGGKAVYQEEIDWLKSLKDRVQPQPKQEWSEEDENRMKKVMHILSLDGRISNAELRSIHDWLESLRPQNRWKPSNLPHWKKSTLPNDNTTGFNSDYFCHKGYNINYKELFEKLPKDD